MRLICICTYRGAYSYVAHCDCLTREPQVECEADKSSTGLDVTKSLLQSELGDKVGDEPTEGEMLRPKVIHVPRVIQHVAR